MSNTLVDFVLKNIWCNPRQDDTYTIQPERLTLPYGCRHTAKVLDRIIPMPTEGDYYHVFQLGLVYPNGLNVYKDLPDWPVDVWLSVKECMSHQPVTIEFYNQQGVMFPRRDVYFMLMDERNLIICLRQNNRIPVNYTTSQYFIKFYLNRYFETDRFPGGQKIVIHSENPLTQQAILDLQTILIQYRALPGYCFCFVNGLLVDEISIATVVIGDYVELVYDRSVKRIVHFPISILKNYLSNLDQERKYLLHYEASDVDSIEFYDDNSIYLTRVNNQRFKGIFNYHHRPASMRMVTHRDYGLSVNDVYDRLQDLNQLTNQNQASIENCRVSLFIREAGYDRGLVYNLFKLNELYKLSDVQIVDTLIGEANSIDLWQASNLEASMYSHVLSKQEGNVTLLEAKNALGYDSIAKYFSDAIIEITPEMSGYVPLPVLLRSNSTIYEYNAEGYLLGHYYNQNNDIYILQNVNTKYIEVLKGEATDAPSVYFNTSSFTLPVSHNWRLYLNHLNNGQVIDNWLDITETSMYSIENQQIVYTTADVNQILMLRTDEKFLALDYTITPHEGLISVNLVEQNLFSGTLYDMTVPVPGLQFDVFINDRPAIEGVDYRIEFPRINLISKQHLIQPAASSEQRLHIRMRGLSLDGANWEPIQDVGFIQYGFLSNNSHFDIRDDAVSRVIINGKLITKDSLKFSENHQGVYIHDMYNGLPYMVQPIAQSIQPLISEDSYRFRESSRVINQRLSNFLTDRLPQPPRTGVFSFPNRYPLYSLFLSGIIFDILRGVIPPTAYKKELTDQQVIELCEPYLSWLEHDVIVPNGEISDEFVVVHPHLNNDTIPINLYAYRFVASVVRIYAKVPIDLSSFLIASTVEE